MSGEILLRGRALTRRWGGLVAVNGVSVELVRGAVHAVIGTNGAGKSTLINLLSGEFPPSSGQIELLGQDVTQWSQPRRARAGLGRSYQRNTIYPSFTVQENCRLSAQARYQTPWAWWHDAQSRGPTQRIAREVAQRVGLGEVLQREAGLLSHGQKRQLEIAMCLATRPRLLLLDEPLHALDVEVREQVRAELRRSLAALGAPTILVTHDRADVLALGDRIAVLVGGTIRQVGPVAEVFGRPADVDVARVLGVETVVEGEITAVRDGLATVRVAGVDLAAVCEHPGPGPVLVCIREGDMVLHRPAAERGSARNHLPARVAWMRSDGVLVRVGLDCGFPLAAVITRTSADELALDVGVRVTASIKAPAVHLIRR